MAINSTSTSSILGSQLGRNSGKISELSSKLQDATKAASSIGTHSVVYDADNFTEYADITEANVIAWLEAGLDVEAMKASLDSQIELQKTPVDTTFHAPFVVVPEALSEEVVEE